jgi:hypothetical protein
MEVSASGERETPERLLSKNREMNQATERRNQRQATRNPDADKTRLLFV